jgi:excisionase family DNA binding protein
LPDADIDPMPETKEPKNPTAASDTHRDKQDRETLGTTTHLTPAEAGRLLGRSPARVREMIRFGELTQEQVGARWLIPLRDVEGILHPSRERRDDKKQAPLTDQRPIPSTKRHEGKLPESTSPSVQRMRKAPTTRNTHDDLAAEIEPLARRMEQIDSELRDLRSGFMNDEKRERIEHLKTEKRTCGKSLQKLEKKLQRELSRRER